MRGTNHTGNEHSAGSSRDFHRFAVSRSADACTINGAFRAYLLGGVSFHAARHLQEFGVALRGADRMDDCLLFVEHPPVLTVGKRTAHGDLGQSRPSWRRQGVEVVDVTRGGAVTFHAPGQLICYPIFHVGRLGVRRFVLSCLRAMEATLRRYGVDARADSCQPGVYVGVPPRKISSVGIEIRGGVTNHGLSVNLRRESTFLRGYVPCGAAAVLPTSLEEELALQGSPCHGVPEVRDFSVYFMAELADCLSTGTT